MYITDSSGLIEIEINDFEFHNFSMIFGGILYEFIFNSSITEAIVLATKSIDATALWDELFVSVVYGSACYSLDLLWYDGTEWIVIDTIDANPSGNYSFSNLILGEFALVETGELFDPMSGLSFTIEQDTTIYTDTIYIVPDKTIVNVEYLNSILGADVFVDLTGVDWVIYGSNDGVSWIDISTNTNYYLSYDLDNIANGVITIYEILQQGYIYKIVIENVWSKEFNITIDGLTEIGLVAKSLEATVLWSSDGTPIEFMMVPLYWFDGSEYVFVDNYMTDEFGMIYITESMPIGMYMLGLTEFTIVADDTIKFVTATVESLDWGEKHLQNSTWDIEFWYFFFFVFKLKLEV